MTIIDDDEGDQDVDQRPRSGELVGHLPVVVTGGEVTGRVVHQDDCGRAGHDIQGITL